ncbi:sialate O-acetylesterase [Tellurirhabdus bombi]|uniref:sialate O-acetylesterase n=1 Tax=Tellurirhabdus bombi TaxID=2907205 RepID=UPI001F30B3CD|nr:sialate O-acetylesterase [Tellurirhabdus bombi]
MTILNRFSKILCLWLVVAAAKADISLPTLITDNMVLQQKTDVALWGWARPGETVKVKASWLRSSVKTEADQQGNWLVRIPTGKAGGPYKLTFSGDNSIEVNNVLLGEVWLCSGQSNMHFPVAKGKSSWETGVTNADEAIPKANYPGIRMFTVERKVAETPQKNVKGAWIECSPQTVGDFSAVAYFFARDVYEKTGFPIGLINSSWGGTPAESWTQREVLESYSSFLPILRRYEQGLTTYEKDYAAYKEQVAIYQKERAENPKLTRSAPREPIGVNSNKSPYKLYNAMIHPLAPYTLKGVIWYQGESNADRAYQYRRLFPMMIDNWRTVWNQPLLPFYFVQIAPHRSQNPEIRESQLVTMQTVSNTGMAVTTDWGDSLDIHPRNKEVVGERLARWALAKQYGQKKLPYSGPIYRSMKTEGNKIRLQFDHVDKGLVAKDGTLREFTIAGADSVFVPAQATIDGKQIVVWSNQVAKPVAVRFAWRYVPDPNLFNGAGLPASPFRTDQWRLITEGKN